MSAARTRDGFLFARSEACRSTSGTYLVPQFPNFTDADAEDPVMLSASVGTDHKLMTASRDACGERAAHTTGGNRIVDAAAALTGLPGVCRAWTD